jgi:hypothetical protein
MKHLLSVGAVALGLIAASCAPTVYDTGTPPSSTGGSYYGVNDFTGQWQLVTNRSDYGQSWMDDRNRFDADNTWGTNDRMRYGAWFLPDEFRIEGDRQDLRIEDTGGGVIADVTFDDARYGSSDNGTYNGTYGRSTRARWLSRRQFQVERTGQQRSITQTYSLENRGRQLVVRTQVDRDGNTRSYTRVYQRV